MSEYKIITVSGPDRVGKETQTRLLQKALTPSVRMSFPNYEHWSGKIIRCLLYGQAFSVGTPDGESITYQEDRPPLLFQYLQEINRLNRQDTIKEQLATSHIIMDRYDVDALVYGLADGCDIQILMEFSRQRLSSDAVVVLTGTSFHRNEEKDQYETDTELQKRARNNYLAVAALEPHKYTCINVDDFVSKTNTEEDKLLSIYQIHVELCKNLGSLLGLKITPVKYAEITRQV